MFKSLKIAQWMMEITVSLMKLGKAGSCCADVNKPIFSTTKNIHHEPPGKQLPGKARTGGWCTRGRDGKAVLVCEHMTSPQSVPSPPEPRQCVECITIERGALFQMSITQAPRPPWLPLKVWEPGEFLCCLNIKPGLRLILLKK